jgi:hypothetical protein
MRTFVLVLLLSAAAFGQSETAMLVPAATVNPVLASSSSLHPMIKAVPLAQPNEAERPRHTVRYWYALAGVSHGASFFDAWTTRQAINTGHRELNPVLKPFANSSAIYPVLQVGPTAMDYLGRRMMRSSNRTVRKFWWLPQAASTAISVECGLHNLHNF